MWIHFTKFHFDEYIISVIISKSNTKVDQSIENLATSLITSFWWVFQAEVSDTNCQIILQKGCTNLCSYQACHVLHIDLDRSILKYYTYLFVSLYNYTFPPDSCWHIKKVINPFFSFTFSGMAWTLGPT